MPGPYNSGLRSGMIGKYREIDMKVRPFFFTVWMCIFASLGTRSFANFEGQKMVDFEFSDLKGNLLESDVFRKDKILFMKLGSLSCPMCSQMLGLMGKLDKEYEKKGVVFLDVSFDTDIGHLKQHAREKNADFPTVMDPENLLAAWYSVQGIPVNILADVEGKILHYSVGLIPEEDLRKILDDAVAARTAEESK